LLPVTLGVALLTTLLDTATVPLLGFAFFIVGFPRPLRGWSASNPNKPAMSDSRSDGHLYASMQAELLGRLQGMIERDPFCLRLGTFQFLKNEKMIMLV
jgi:hypothetical protein